MIGIWTILDVEYNLAFFFLGTIIIYLHRKKLSHGMNLWTLELPTVTIFRYEVLVLEVRLHKQDLSCTPNFCLCFLEFIFQQVVIESGEFPWTHYGFKLWTLYGVLFDFASDKRCNQSKEFVFLVWLIWFLIVGVMPF